MTKAGKWKGHCACGAIQYKSKEESHPFRFIVNADSAREQREAGMLLYLWFLKIQQSLLVQ